MKAVARSNPADFVRPKLTEARVARMWNAIDAARTRPAPRRSRQVVVAGALAAAACLALLVWLRPWTDSPSNTLATGDVVVTGARGQRVTLPDGSQLSLDATTQMDVVRATPGEIRLRLGQGRLTCDVPARPDREFVVEAGGTEVVVKGTRFTVELEGGIPADAHLSVNVERGKVQVRHRAEQVIATLDAGQTWTRSHSPPPELAPLPSASPPTSAQQPALPKPRGPTAQRLMEQANAARIAGRSADAARDYDRLRQRFPGDARAGLAAFELARIRLHRLGDPGGALEAFNFALRRNRGGFFAEDALAGKVEALGRMGDAARCREARDAFLKRHGKSPHARRIKKLCPGR